MHWSGVGWGEPRGGESMNFEFWVQEYWTSLSKPWADTQTLLGIRTTKNVIFNFTFKV